MTERLRTLFLLCFLLITSFPTPGPSQVIIATQRYDNARTGQNLSETILNTSNVNPIRFGKLFTRAVDDEIYAQPLIVSNVTIPNVGTRNVLYVATVNNSIYAFDADDPGAAAPLWRVNLTRPVPGARPVKARDVGQRCGTRGGVTDNIGVVGTPVIDAVTRTLYVVARTKKESLVIDSTVRALQVAARAITSVAFRIPYEPARRAITVVARKLESVTAPTKSFAKKLGAVSSMTTGLFVQELHALDIATGAARPNSPVVIKAQVKGTGAGSSMGILPFNPWIQNQRGALVLANGIVYITWAAHCDTGPYHGWIIGYDPTTLAQVLAKVVTPDGEAGGIWQSNAGPSTDASGNVYLTVGDGTISAPKGGQDYGNAFLKLSPSGEILDWFIPYNYAALNVTDSDVGSAGVLLIPETNLLASGGKEGKLYLLNRNNLGHFQPGSDSQIIQSVMVAADGLYGTPTYWNGPGGPYIYTWGALEHGKMFRLRDGRLLTPAISQTPEDAEMPGGILSISANGTTAGTGILWAALGLGNANLMAVPGALRAFDAADLSRELWNSRQNAARDDLGLLSKFNTPIVANGKVYVATFSRQVVVYGLLNQ